MTDKGVKPGPNWLKAASGTICSTRVLTAVPAEAAPRTVLAIAFWAWLRTASEAISPAGALWAPAVVAGNPETGAAALAGTVVVPAAAPVVWVPLIFPAVLT